MSDHTAEDFDLDPWDQSDERPEPVASDDMFYGPVGRFALAAGQHTEADPAAVYAQALTLFGAMLGRGPHVEAGNDRHTCAEYTLVIGKTAKARKGTSWAVARDYVDGVEPGFTTRQVASDFGSGEALVELLAPDPDDENAEPKDTRLVIHEPEFASILDVAGRKGSTIASHLRRGWDGHPVSNRVKGRHLLATGYHMAVCAHVTADEFREKITGTDIAGGLLNRFLMVYARRGRLHPHGGNVPRHLLIDHVAAIRQTVERSRRRAAHPVTYTLAGDHAWSELYEELADDAPPGALGSVTSRGDTHCLRLSLLFAMLDDAESIDECHVDAARALWSYCRATAGYVFGDSTGSPDADKLLAALREAAPHGLDGTALGDLLPHGAGRIAAARRLLERRGLAATVTVATGGAGRSTLLTFATKAPK